MNPPRRRRYEGRYTYVSSEFWRDPDVQTLTREARHLLLCLMTGSLGNQAGIFAFNLEAIVRDFESRGEPLTRADVETLLGELEKRPSPSHSFIVRDHDALWIRNQLRDDPAKRSENTRKGIRWDLSRVPRTSRVVKQYRKYYAYILDEGAHQGAGEAGRQEAREVPENPSDSPSGSGEKRTLPVPIPRASDQSRPPRQPPPSASGDAPAGSGIVGVTNNTNGPPTRRDAEARDKAAAALADYQRNFPNDGRRPA